LENKELKKKLDKVELDKSELKEILSKKENPGKKILQEESELNALKEVRYIILLNMF
jgi:hypothetical protein